MFARIFAIYTINVPNVSLLLSILNNSFSSTFSSSSKISSSSSISFIKDTLIHGNYDLLYSTIKEKELETKEMLVKFEDDYPKVLNEDNMDNILNILNSRKSNNNHWKSIIINARIIKY